MKLDQNIPSSSGSKDTELRRVYLAFMERPLTMKEVDKAAGIMRESICWYCRSLRLSGRLYAVKQRVCTITKHRAMTWTTNPDLVPDDCQMKLF